MTSNIPAINEVYADLERVLAKLQAIDAAAIESANLVPMIKAVQNIGAFSAAIDAQIQARAVANGELIPGVAVKGPDQASPMARSGSGRTACAGTVRRRGIQTCVAQPSAN